MDLLEIKSELKVLVYPYLGIRVSFSLSSILRMSQVRVRPTVYGTNSYSSQKSYGRVVVGARGPGFKPGLFKMHLLSPLVYGDRENSLVSGH